MRLIRVLGASAMLAAIAVPLQAQQQGQVEIGVHGRWAEVDDRLGLDGGIGPGGRLGVFLTNWFALEGEFEQVRMDRDVSSGGIPAGKYDYTPLYVRGSFNFGVAPRTSLIAGLGYARQDYDFEVKDAASGLLGLRFRVHPNIAIRVDGLADYTPSSEDWNYGARAGLSFLFGGRKAAPPPPEPEVAPQAPPPAPPAQPAPPPAPPRDETPALRSRLEERILFDFDAYTIRPDAAQALEAKLPILQANPGVRIRVEGHADPRGSDEYNLALGERRANAVRRWLVDRGIAADRIETVSFGEERLVCHDTTESCYQENRRATFVIVAGGENLRSPR